MPTDTEIQAHLREILEHDLIRNSPRQTEMLKFLVNAKLDGRSETNLSATEELYDGSTSETDLQNARNLKSNLQTTLREFYATTDPGPFEFRLNRFSIDIVTTQSKPKPTSRRNVFSWAVAVLVVLAISRLLFTSFSDREPKIQLTEIPPSDPGGEAVFPISGTTTNAPADAVVVIWAQAADNYYWVQPREDAYQTLIDQNGSFSTTTHGGLIYAIALVNRDFVTPKKRLSVLGMGDAVYAIVTVQGAKPED